VQRRRAGRGVLGSAVIQEKVTELLDLQGVIRLVDDQYGAGSPDPELETPLAA